MASPVRPQLLSSALFSCLLHRRVIRTHDLTFNNTQYSVSVGVVILSGGLSHLQKCSPTRMVPLYVRCVV